MMGPVAAEGDQRLVVCSLFRLSGQRADFWVNLEKTANDSQVLTGRGNTVLKVLSSWDGHRTACLSHHQPSVCRWYLDSLQITLPNTSLKLLSRSVKHGMPTFGDPCSHVLQQLSVSTWGYQKLQMRVNS